MIASQYDIDPIKKCKYDIHIILNLEIHCTNSLYKFIDRDDADIRTQYNPYVRIYFFNN